MRVYNSQYDEWYFEDVELSGLVSASRVELRGLTCPSDFTGDNAADNTLVPNEVGGAEARPMPAPEAGEAGGANARPILALISKVVGGAEARPLPALIPEAGGTDESPMSALISKKAGGTDVQLRQMSLAISDISGR